MISRVLASLRHRLREALVRTIRVPDGPHTHVFRCESPIEIWRARTLFTKEEGTVQWIRSDVELGQVFYDIGANIGLYSILAAHRVGADGAVYAFEPHLANAFNLLRNVQANGLERRIRVLSCPLSDCEGLFDFNYRDWTPGSALSQLNDLRDEEGRDFMPVCSETKLATTIDRLVGNEGIRAAHHVKIDVDGGEFLILKGMRRLLTGSCPPRSLQVEINRRYRKELFEFLADCRYRETERHYTALGKSRLARGESAENVPFNAIFRPVS